MKEVKFISLNELREMRANKEDLKLIEGLSEDHFKNGHIPGAIHIPLEDLIEETLAKKNITKEDTIVTYCTSDSCTKSTEAARKLLNMGYENIFAFKAGKKGWDNAGLELEVDWEYVNKQLEKAWGYVGMGGKRRAAKLAQ